MLRNGVNWLSNVIKQCYSLERDSSPAGQLIRSNLLNSLQEPHYWTKPFGTNLQHQSLFILRSVTVLFSHLCPHIFRQKKKLCIHSCYASYTSGPSHHRGFYHPHKTIDKGLRLCSSSSAVFVSTCVSSE